MRILCFAASNEANPGPASRIRALTKVPLLAADALLAAATTSGGSAVSADPGETRKLQSTPTSSKWSAEGACLHCMIRRAMAGVGGQGRQLPAAAVSFYERPLPAECIRIVSFCAPSISRPHRGLLGFCGATPPGSLGTWLRNAFRREHPRMRSLKYYKCLELFVRGAHSRSLQSAVVTET